MSTPQDRPRPRFKTKEETVVSAADPESLFGELPRTPGGVGALWSHQADQLREYARDHRDTADVALELPTGSGKTLVGLLIADWRRRTLGQRVVYACPTKQLARQVVAKAVQQGVPVVLLIGSNKDWDDKELLRYSRGQAIAITVYSAIFNAYSHLADAETLLFDDAHAAEGFVAEAWALDIPRAKDVYSQLFDALGDDAEPHFVSRMVAPDSPAADGGEIRMLPITVVAKRADSISAVLATLSGDLSWRYRMLRANLTSCLFFVARSGFYIRPMIPPTFQHGPFTDPEQRIYLSATLGDAGELERAFGRTPIARVPVPRDWARTGSGRRFFVFPALATGDPDAGEAVEGDGGDGAGLDDTAPGSLDTPANEGGQAPAQMDLNPGLTGKLLGLGPKRLVLTPDDKGATRLADLLGVPAGERYTAKDPETGLQPFLDADKGTLLAPNRYDGMDLADEACRLMLMSGLPTATHLQDRFLETKLRAGEVLKERIRTRVVQGAGRCTRGPKDWAVVVVEGQDLLRFLSRREVIEALPVELQAEVMFGMAISSDSSAEDLVLLAESALLQDSVWQEDAEPDLAKRRREAVRTAPPNVDQLAASALREVKAWRLAWQLDWDNAARAAVDVLEHLRAPELRPYRALWFYLGSAWSSLAAEAGVATAQERATSMLARAHKEAAGTTWLKEVQQAPASPPELEPIDEDALDRLLALYTGPLRSPAKFSETVAKMLAGLAQTEALKYEAALVALGRLAGADSTKPPGKGRSDAAWVWPGCWVTVEAKSEQKAEGLLSMEYVRQTNTQLDSLAADRGVDEPPEGSASVIVTPRPAIDPDAVSIARPHVHITRPKLMLDLGHDLTRAWKEFREAAPGVGDAGMRDEGARILWQNRVLPTQIVERLTRDPIRGR